MKLLAVLVFVALVWLATWWAVRLARDPFNVNHEDRP